MNGTNGMNGMNGMKKEEGAFNSKKIEMVFS